MRIALALIALLPTIAMADCYRMYSPAGNVIYEDLVPPYSLAYPQMTPEAQASRARGEHLMVLPAEHCRPEVIARHATLAQANQWIDYKRVKSQDAEKPAAKPASTSKSSGKKRRAASEQKS